MQPLVSICVPIYNVEKYIERCANSLFGQSYDNLEYIFVDDNTPDDSINILKKTLLNYPGRVNSVVILKNTVNAGVAVSRNTAIENCSGEFMLWVDPDDYIALETVEYLIKKQQATDSDIVLFDYNVIYSNYTTKWKRVCDIDNEVNVLNFIARKVPVTIHGMLIRVSLYRDYNIKAEPGVNVGEDYWISTRLLYNSQKVSSVSLPLYYYDRRNESSIMNVYSTEKTKQAAESVRLVREFFQNKGAKYADALKEAEIELIYRRIINSFILNDKKGYCIACEKLKTIDKKYLQSIVFYRRPIFNIRQYFFARTYYKVFKFIKSVFGKYIVENQ